MSSPSKTKLERSSIRTLIIILGVMIVVLSIILVTQRIEIANLKLTEQLAHSTIQGSEGNLAIGVHTDELMYSRGQHVNINGTVSNASGPTNAKVLLQVFHLDSNSSIPMYQSSVFANSTYHDNGLKVNLVGKHKVNVIALSNGNNSIQGQAYTLFEVLDPFNSLPAFFLYGTGLAFVALMILIRIDVKRSSYEISIIHFILLSTIAILPILGLIFTDFETGAGATLGLVIDPLLQNGTLLPGGEWVINIGGHQENYYAQGIQIPVYVIIFGLIGGYIRYLYKNSHLQITTSELDRIKKEILYSEGKRKLEVLKKHHVGLNDDAIKNFMDQNPGVDKKTAALHILIIRERRKFAFYQSLKDITLFMLSPLLAIAVWFFLSQGVEGGTVEPYLIAIVSFSVGLITEQVIEALKQFSSNIMVKGSREAEKTTDRKEHAKEK
jgi:hypothetical protein